MPDLHRVECGRIGQHSCRVRGLEEILIPLHRGAKRESLEVLGEKNLGLYFGVDGLGEYIIERQAEQKGAQIVDIGNSPESIKISFRRQPSLFAALFERRRPD